MKVFEDLEDCRVGSSLVAQWFKDLVLLLWLWLQLWRGFDLWLRNFGMLRAWGKKDCRVRKWGSLPQVTPSCPHLASMRPLTGPSIPKNSQELGEDGMGLLKGPHCVSISQSVFSASILRTPGQPPPSPGLPGTSWQVTMLSRVFPDPGRAISEGGGSRHGCRRSR